MHRRKPIGAQKRVLLPAGNGRSTRSSVGCISGLGGMHFNTATHTRDIKYMLASFLDYLGLGHVRVMVTVFIRRLPPFSAAVKLENGVLVIETSEFPAQLPFAYNHSFFSIRAPRSAAGAVVIRKGDF